MDTINQNIKSQILEFQKNELTEYFIYKSLSRLAKTENNRSVLKKISEEELNHYHIWLKYSGQTVKIDSLKRWFYVAVSAIFGLTFGIKLMENGEANAQESYDKISSVVPQAQQIRAQEVEHENALVEMIDEERLKYIGSVVLGLNDALVEFTGALAGFTFALQNSRLIGMTGLIMGFSASLSMAASEYLSTKTEDSDRNPARASLYTGIAYVITVVFLILPYFLFSNYYLALVLTIMFAILLILVFNFYFSVVRGISFKERFLEMAAISMGIAALSFGVGLLVRKFLGVNI